MKSYLNHNPDGKERSPREVAEAKARLLSRIEGHADDSEPSVSAGDIRAALSANAALAKALNHYSTGFCEGWCKEWSPDLEYADCSSCLARVTLAKLGAQS